MVVVGPLKIEFNQGLKLTTPLFLNYQKINYPMSVRVSCNTPYYVIERKNIKGSIVTKVYI